MYLYLSITDPDPSVQHHGLFQYGYRMVHGLLQDRHGEFFIQQTLSRASSPQSPHASASAPPHPQQQCHSSGEDTNAAEWHQGFQVSMQALPPGITVGIAENILFVGKAVRVLQRPTGPLKSHDLLPHSDAISFAQALRQLQQRDVFDQIGFERTVELIRTTVRSDFMQEQQAKDCAVGSP